MASIVLGAAGAVVGSIFGGPLGASLGWAIGSALGGLFEKQKGQEGPRVTDLHIQNSQYGIMIPIVYGTVRIAGNVIWQTDLQEHSHSSGGKGGGPKITTYSYTVSFAALICEGPILGISRIWANKRLRYDQRVSDADDFPFTLYLGTTTQLPDPTMEADKGVGHVPAHRGYAYIVFDDIPVEEFGNAIPSLEFEVIAQENASIQRVNQWSPPHAGGLGYLNGIGFDGTNFHIATYTTGTPGAYTRDGYTFDGTSLGNELSTTIDSPHPEGGPASFTQVQNSYAAALYAPGTSITDLRTYWTYDGALCSGQIVPPVPVTNEPFVVYGCPFYARGGTYAIGGDGDCYIAKWNSPSGIPDGTISAYYILRSAPSFAMVLGTDVTVDEVGDVWVFHSRAPGSPEVWHLDGDLNLIQYIADATTSLAYTTGLNEATVYHGYVVSNDGVGGASLSQASGSFPVVDTDTSVTFASGMLSLGGGYFLTSDGVFKIPGPITLQFIVDDLSDRSGLDVGEYETNDLTQLVNGYVIPQQMDVRSALEPLMTAYFADAVESGPAIKYVNRGAAPDETIGDDDLQAYEEGQEPPAIVAQTRTQEIDLPRSVTVSAFDMNADYQIGAQLAKREVVNTTQEMSITFALVLTPKEMKQIADRIMYDSWAKRRHITFTTARKWSKLEPTDVKIVHGYTLFITQRDEGVGGVLKFDAVATRSQIFGQSGSAGVLIGSGGFVPPTPPSSGPASLLMLDLPLITDGDYPNGVYAAMSGFSGSANLYKSSDGGTTYNSLLTTLTPDTVGHATSVLGDFFGGNVVDRINYVDVTLDAGAADLSSVTLLAMFNGANEALVGSEIIQYATATLIGTRTYRLRDLLRGRRGTEWAMSAHISGEDFVVLPVNVNVNAPFGELGLARLYKAVASGQTVASATAVSFTNTGVALKPYSPVHVGGGRNASGDIVINWVRRTRIGGAWVDYVDAPLSEATEQYEVRIYTSNAYVAAYNAYTVSGAHTYTYPAADQTSDSGGLIAPLYVGVSQLGSYGYGYEGRGII